jgi:hypothetical protein
MDMDSSGSEEDTNEQRRNLLLKIADKEEDLVDARMMDDQCKTNGLSIANKVDNQEPLTPLEVRL